MIAQPSAKTRLTLAEYEALPETNRQVDFIDGFLVEQQLPILRHQEVLGNVAILLDCIGKRTRGKVYISPVGVKLSDQDIPEPDVIYITLNGQGIYGSGETFASPALNGESIAVAPIFAH